MFLELQPLWPYSIKKSEFSDLGCSSRHVISKTKSVTPHFFYISDITNSSSFNGKILRKKSVLENFRANVLKENNKSNMFITPNHTGDYCFISKELKVPNFHVAQYRTDICICGPDKFNLFFFSIENVPYTFNYFIMRRTNWNERFWTESKLRNKKGERHKDCVYEK